MEKPVLKHPAKPPKELLKSTGFLLKRVGFGIKERTFEAFEAQGANPYQHGVLCTLAESARETQADIADALGYDRSWLVGLLDELEEQGYIERKPDPADRRRNVVTLKEKGRARLLELRQVTKRVEEDFFAPLSTDEREQLHVLLQKLAAGNDPRFKANGSK